MSSKADYLKTKFVTGAVLKEVDFSDLIDLADDSRIKLGLTSDFPEPLPGLENTSKQLALKVGDGLEINPQNNQVQVKIKPNAGIEATADGLVLKTDPNGGLNLDQAGLLINYGDGLKLDGYAGESKLSIDANTGLIVNASGIQVNLAADSGLELGDHGLKVKVDPQSKYLTLSENGLDLSESGKLLLEQSGNRTFIQAIENVRHELTENSSINFPNLETTLEKGGRELWEKDISETIEALRAADAEMFSAGIIMAYLTQQKAISDCIYGAGFYYKIDAGQITRVPNSNTFNISLNINVEPKNQYIEDGEENGCITYNLYCIYKNSFLDALDELFKGDYSSTEHINFLKSEVVNYKVEKIKNSSRETSTTLSVENWSEDCIYMVHATFKIDAKPGKQEEDQVKGTIAFFLGETSEK